MPTNGIAHRPGERSAVNVVLREIYKALRARNNTPLSEERRNEIAAKLMRRAEKAIENAAAGLGVKPADIIRDAKQQPELASRSRGAQPYDQVDQIAAMLGVNLDKTHVDRRVREQVESHRVLSRLVKVDGSRGYRVERRHVGLIVLFSVLLKFLEKSLSQPTAKKAKRAAISKRSRAAVAKPKDRASDAFAAMDLKYRTPIPRRPKREPGQ